MREFIEAVIAYAPVGLAPLRTQLATARACNQPNGWIRVTDVAKGSPIAWPPGPPGLDLFPYGGTARVLGPQRCYWAGLQFHADGRLESFEFYSDCFGSMDIAKTTAWLNAIRPSPEGIAYTENVLATYARDVGTRPPSSP